MKKYKTVFELEVVQTFFAGSAVVGAEGEIRS